MAAVHLVDSRRAEKQSQRKQRSWCETTPILDVACLMLNEIIQTPPGIFTGGQTWQRFHEV